MVNLFQAVFIQVIYRFKFIFNDEFFLFFIFFVNTLKWLD